MKPLLNIRSVPISIEHKVTKAELKPLTAVAPTPRANITRQRGGMNMTRKPAQVQIDSTEARASVGLKSTRRSIGEFAADGKEAAREATVRYAEEGHQMVASKGKGNPIAEIAAAKISEAPTNMQLTFIPSTGPEISVDPGDLSIQYNMDKLTFDWNLNTKPQLEYVPGNIEFVVTQYPEIVIEYVGEPIYVPASANPNYVPPPTVDIKG